MDEISKMGLRINGCQRLQLTLAAISANVCIIEFAEAIAKLTMTAKECVLFSEELKQIASAVPGLGSAKQNRKSRFVIQQHKYAMRYHGRK